MKNLILLRLSSIPSWFTSGNIITTCDYKSLYLEQLFIFELTLFMSNIHTYVPVNNIKEVLTVFIHSETQKSSML